MGGGLEEAMPPPISRGGRLSRHGLRLPGDGISPAQGGVKRLPQLVGAPAAFDLMLSGKTVDAKKAKKLGLADEAAPPA